MRFQLNLASRSWQSAKTLHSIRPVVSLDIADGKARNIKGSFVKSISEPLKLRFRVVANSSMEMLQTKLGVQTSKNVDRIADWAVRREVHLEQTLSEIFHPPTDQEGNKLNSEKNA